jgi:hypothetical protein
VTGPERGADGTTIDLDGVVELRVVAAGSRAERAAPFLVTGEGRAFALFLVGDNAMEQPTLAALAGRRVRITGGVWRNGVVRVERAALATTGS